MKKYLVNAAVGLALAGAGGYSIANVTNTARPQVTQDQPSYRHVVKDVLPAVVSIEAKVKPKAMTMKGGPQRMMPFEGIPGLPEEFRRELEKFGKAPMPREQGSGRAFGSGFIVDPNGVILTNEHVVRGAEEVEVRLNDGRKFVGKDIKRDPKTDLAVVRIDCKESLPFLKIGNSDEMEVGDRVLALGAPLGLTGSVTSGIISAKGRDINLNMYEDFIQTDAAINPGNSGGPLVNLAGEVIGINSAIKSGSGGFQGIGLAISSNLARNVMDQLRGGGMVQRGFLGVQTQPLDPEVASRLGVRDQKGVVIAKVGSGSPAAKAGMMDGDVLTDIAGQTVKSPKQLQQLVAGLGVGKTVEVGVVRDGERKTLSLKVEEQPETFGSSRDLSEPMTSESETMGLKVADLTAERAKEFGFSGKIEGVIVTEVDPNAAAASAGLVPGLVIQKVNAQRVSNVEEFRKALENASSDKGVLLQVRTPQGGLAYVMVKADKK